MSNFNETASRFMTYRWVERYNKNMDYALKPYEPFKEPELEHEEVYIIKNKHWTEKEDQHMIDAYKHKSCIEIAKEMRRPVSSVRHRRRYLQKRGYVIEKAEGIA